MRYIETTTNVVKHYFSFFSYDLASAYARSATGAVEDHTRHLHAAVGWLCRAQDAAGDGGVARSYSLVYNNYFKRRGWTSSYPETTGYIIPTMFDYARYTKRKDIFDRTIRMADWECRVQMKSGAVQGGTVDQPPTPAIFNTGQVIFGWARAFQETGKQKYLDSAIKAGKYLVEQQDKDGSWRKNLSDYASKEMPYYTYNTRTAWALLQLSTITNDASFKEAAVKNIDFALNQQLDNGWFKFNCLSDSSQPLLHTIAYCIRGIMESGVLLGSQLYIDRASLAADALIKQQGNDGSLSGCFNDKWEPTVPWTCLTGNAQMSIIWGRLFQITNEHKYLDSMIRTNKFLKSVQLLKTKNPDIYGGIAGSYPLHGGYGRFEILNWAVKFFIDALMLENSIEGNKSALK